DVTAFQHALKTAGRLHRAGKKMTDDVIVDAYREAYEVAHSVGADDRPREEPPMRDLRSLARRVRGYVSSNKRVEHAVPKESPTDSRMRPQERKALATLGRRGGKKAAERWKDPNSDYAKKERNKLATANRERSISAQADRLGIASWFLSQYSQTKQWPTVSEAEVEFKVSKSTVLRALKTAKVELPKGRRGAQK